MRSVCVCGGGGPQWVPKGGKDSHLIFDEEGLTPLHIAAKNGHFDVVKLLLQHTSVVDALSRTDRTTPLIYAAYSGHLQIVRYLIEEKQAKVSHTDISDRNAFYYARTYGRFDVAEYLSTKQQPDAWTQFSRYLGSVFMAADKSRSSNVDDDVVAKKSRINFNS